MEEVLFITDKGNEIYLPEKTGNALGFERAKTFSPPEISKKAGADIKVSEPSVGISLAEAVDVIESFANDEKDMTNEEAHQLTRLTNIMFDSVDRTEGKEGQTSGPSLIEFIGQLEAKMDADTKISKTGREAVGKHIQDLLSATPDAAPLADPASTSTTDPKESDQPGKAQ